MNNDPRNIMPGDRVMVFDYTLFKDDVSTPLSYTVRPATVLRRYGYNPCWDTWKRIGFGGSKLEIWNYPDCVDVKFDHRGESRGHFTNGVKTI